MFLHYQPHHYWNYLVLVQSCLTTTHAKGKGNIRVDIEESRDVLPNRRSKANDFNKRTFDEA